MTHLKHEEIAKLVEGNVNSKDRRTFLTHISQCDRCSAVYSDTARFMEEEAVPPKPDLKAVVQTVRETFTAFTAWKYRFAAAAAAAVFLLLTLLPVASKENARGIEYARSAHIETNLTQLEILTFSPARDDVYAAIRTGILSEDLSELDNLSHNAALRQKLVNLLNRQPGTSRPPDPQQRAELTRFGRFLERSALDTFENKLPKPQDIAAYRRIAQKYRLPRGVLIGLKKLETAAGPKKYRDVHRKITEIVFE